MHLPWKGVIREPLGQRSLKPRRKGLTMVIDKGLGLRELQDLLEIGGNYLDLLKLGFGTSVLYDEKLLRHKIDLCKSAGVQIYPGGTLTEIALLQGHYEEYLNRALELGFETIEISDGTIELSRGKRRHCIKTAVEAGLKVITEVGKKDPSQALKISAQLSQSHDDLDCGAWKVIIEARESGKGIGIYDKNGVIKEDLLHEFVVGCDDCSSLIWEAPLKTQQTEMILRFGPEVNLGNIPTNELIALEALRCGLRGDTLSLMIPACELM